MANNVYIGMRYVPIFDGAWDATKSYEALVIVEYGNNTYTSKKPVPVGTLPTNTTYWALTGNYNGQIADLQTKYNNLKTLVDFINTNEDVTTKKILLITDSYGHFLNDATQNYPYKLQQNLGCALDFRAIDGSGFVGSSSAQTFAQTYSSVLDKTYTDIIFAGGYNDNNVNYATLQSAVENTLALVNADYDNVNIWVVAMGASADSDVNYKLQTTVSSYFYACCKYPNVRFVNISTCLMRRDLLAMDGVHPGGNGQSEIANALAAAIKGQYYGGTQARYSSEIIDINGVTKQGYVLAGMNNGVAHTRILKLEQTLNSAINNFTCDGQFSHEIKICDLHNPLIFGGSLNTINANLYVRGKQTSSSNSVFWNISGFYYVYDSELRFVPMRLSEGYSSWFSLYSVDWVASPQLDFISIPYMQ